MTTIRDRILALLSDDATPMLAAEIAVKLGIGLRSATSTLANLRQEGLTEAVPTRVEGAHNPHLMHTLSATSEMLPDALPVAHRALERHGGIVRRVERPGHIVRVEFGSSWKPEQAQRLHDGISIGSSLNNLQGVV